MKMALYAAGDLKGVKVLPTLEFAVDRWWWKAAKTEQETAWAEKDFFRLVPVSGGMPLQWALQLAGNRLGAESLDWSRQEWERWLRHKLRDALEKEDAARVGSLLGLDIRSMEETAQNENAERRIPSRFNRIRLWTEKSDRLAQLLEGRSLLRGELESLLGEQPPEGSADWKSAVQLAYLQGRISMRAAVERSGREAAALSNAPGPKRLSLPLARLLGHAGAGTAAAHVCARCGSAASGGPCDACGSADCAGCEACRTLGRSRSCELLVQGVSKRAAAISLPAWQLPEKALRLDRWKLSPAQTDAAELALRFLEEEARSPAPPKASKLPAGPGAGTRRDASGWAAGDPASRFLLWAVTGAGKTEMLFPLIESVRSRGGLVAVATPRRDVVLELAPRLRRAFPGEKIVVLYGGSEERWRQGDVVLATTHQLLRFAQAFDLVVIDELDAFPFHGDPMLAYAAEAARAPGGRTVYLSATPPSDLQRLVRSGRVACAKVPVRYHRHPLPVPELLRAPKVADFVRQGRLPPALLRRWRTSLARGAQIFVFVPKIALAEPLAALLRRAFKNVPVGATSSRDEDRAGKVLSFRSAELRMLVTTTILERGVTVPRSDVYVLDADSGLFDEASLVQMAGRAGRSADDPAGAVVFAAAQKTRAQAGARRQIRRMNRLAAPYLLPRAGRSPLPRRILPPLLRPIPGEAVRFSAASAADQAALPVPPVPLEPATAPLPSLSADDFISGSARGKRP